MNTPTNSEALPPTTGSVSSTPETNAFKERVRSGSHPDYWKFAEKLERERNELIAALTEIRGLNPRRFGDYWYSDEAIDLDTVREICDAALPQNAQADRPPNGKPESKNDVTGG